MDFELRVDHGHGIRTHRAGAYRVVLGVGAGPDIGLKGRIVIA